MSPKLKPRLLFALAVAALIGGFVFATRFLYGVLGAQDATWIVRTDAPKQTMKTLQRRFSADQRYFDMEVHSGAVRLVADERYSDLVHARVGWDGGLIARRVDATVDLPDPGGPGITVLPADGVHGRRWRGTSDALYEAFQRLNDDPLHAVLLFRVRGYGSSGIYETIVVDKEEAWHVAGDTTPAEAGERSLECYPTKDGRGIFCMLPEDAAKALHALDAKAGKDSAEAAASPQRYALTAGPSTLGMQWLTEDRGLIVQLGEDVGAYEYAFRVFMRVSGGGLPKYLPVVEAKLPVDVPLVVLHIAVPLIIAALWFAIARRMDRAAPKPWWLVILTGAVALAINPLVLYLRMPIEGIDWLDPHIADRVGRVEAFPSALLAYAVHAGAPEELVKLLPVLMVARWTKHFDEPIDGILYCTASAVGFSCIEEYGYLFYGRMHASLLVLRATSTPPAHIFFTAIVGYALGQGIGKGWRAIPIGVVGFVGSVLAHALYDALVSFPALQVAARVYLVALLLLFTYLVRRARRGSKRRVAPAPGAVVVRVGSYLVVAAMTIAIAVGTLLLRELAFRASPESTYTTAGTMTVLVLLSLGIGGAAFVLVSTLPVDAVVDEVGITYAGVTYGWDEIRCIAYSGRRGRFGPLSSVIVRMAEREISIGPLRDPAAVSMYAAIDVHRPHAPAAATA